MDKKTDQLDVRVLVLNDKDLILLVLEKGGIKTLPGGKSFQKPQRWGLPGGRKEPGDEDEIAVAIREIHEETGLWIDVNQRTRLEKDRGDHLKVGLIGYPVAGEIKIDPEEILDCRWFARRILYDNEFDMYPGHRMIAQELLEKLRR